MIYLDNAATSKFKPESVIRAVLNQLKDGANPGRGAHSDSVRAAAAVVNARDSVRALIRSADAEVVFTKNCTEALNLAIFGTVQIGGHVVATSNEHNSVLRPLFELERMGKIRLTILPPSKDGAVEAEDIERALTRETYLVCVNHISNVTGAKADIEAIGKIASKRKILFLVDGAQSLGHVEIDMKKCGIDLLAAAGHKGLHGPQGTGFLAFNPRLAESENGGFFSGISQLSTTENSGFFNGISQLSTTENNVFSDGISYPDRAEIDTKKRGIDPRFMSAIPKSTAPPLHPSHGGEYSENNSFFGGIDPRLTIENNDFSFNGISQLSSMENKEFFGGIDPRFAERNNGLFSYDFYGKIRLKPLLYGGTGTASDSVYQPFSAPEGFESGTVNTPGICGLSEGIKWTLKNQNEIREKIRELSRELLTGLSAMKKITLYTSQNDLNGVVSFNVGGMTSSDVGDLLNENYGIAVRTGLHCAPLVHRRLGTLKNGAVRAGIGYNNSSADIKKLLSAVKEISR
jgi:selenocysteine lyase/cysteine desulfurase